jgi:hypothetical protein
VAGLSLSEFRRDRNRPQAVGLESGVRTLGRWTIGRPPIVAGDFGQGEQDNQDCEIQHQADDRHEGDSLGSLAAGLIAGCRQRLPKAPRDDQDDD